jgi:Ca2+-binding RTX toxin-like protein
VESRQGTRRPACGRPAAVGLAFALVLLWMPASALAGGVLISNGELEYSANDGETNAVTVSAAGGQVTLKDAGNAVTLLPLGTDDCTQDATDQVTCPALSVNVRAGDLDDSVDATAAPIERDGGTAVFISGGEGGDTVTGSPKGDFIAGGSGQDHIEGREGADSLSGGDDNDVLIGGDGNDSLEAVAFESLGTDMLEGDAGDDTLAQPGRGAPGIGDGADTFTGGPGNDTASYQASTGSQVLSLDGAPNDGYAGEGDNIEADVENLVGGPAGDTITGSDAGNALDGGGGDDAVRSLGGDDQLTGGDDAGNDSLAGGDGNDRATGGAGDDALEGDAGDDTLEGSGGSDSESGGPGIDAMAGGAGTDDMSGGPGNDAMRGADAGGVGGDGEDKIRGDEGKDALSGEGGDDKLAGGAGADSLAGGPGEDDADYTGATAALKVTLDGRANDGARGEGDNVRTDVENVAGGDAGVTITGAAGANRLTGGAGEDYADGASGPDSLTGGRNHDFLRARDGAPDAVDCGPNVDFAIADRADRVSSSCERVDRGNSRARNGRTMLVRPRGTNSIRLPNVIRFVPLRDRVGLPFGTTLDPAGHSINIAAVTSRGTRQSGQFRGSPFRVDQAAGSSLTELHMTSAPTAADCRTSGRATAYRRSSKPLFGHTHGHFRTRGRHSSATSRGTRWEIQERCDGTFTRVIAGSVAVFDFTRHRRVLLHAGQKYLARAQRGH